MRRKKLGTIFVELGILDADQEKAALEYAQQSGVPFGTACVKMGFIDEPTVVQGLAVQMGAPSVSLAGVSPAPEVLAKLTADQAEKYRVIPVSVLPGPGKGTLVVAVSSPREIAVMDELAFLAGHRISFVIASDRDIEEALFRLYGRDVQRHTKSSNMEGGAGGVPPGSANAWIELEGEPDAFGEDAEVVHDPLRLALDFLPTVSID